MLEREKPVDPNLLGDETVPPNVGGEGTTESLVNVFAKDDPPCISRHEYNEGMASMKAHMKEVTDMLRILMSGSHHTATTTVTPDIPKSGEGDVISRSRDDGGNGTSSIPLTGNGSGIHAAVPPPLSFSSLPLPEPHFAHVGPPPILEKYEYPLWAFRMKNHMRGSSKELWTITEEGFHVHDRKNMTPREYRDNTLNNHALLMIQKGLKGEQENRVRKITTAKECWDYLESSIMGSSSIRSSKFDKVQDQADHFVMIDGESPEDLYQRLVALANLMTDHGSMDTDDGWIKRKFITAILPHKKQTTKVIRQSPDFSSLTAQQVLDEFVSMEILDSTADLKLARQRVTKTPSLALKAKEVQACEEEDEEDGAPEDTKHAFNEHTKYAFNEHMALASRQFWGNKKNFKTNSSSFKPKGQRIRTCFNCGNVSHFVADCPYEKREDHGGKLIRKDKSKSPLNKTFVKKKPQRVLVAQEEYFSDDDDDDEGGEVVATANIAIVTKSSPSTSLFNSPNENPRIIHKCLMAKTTSVTPHSKPFISTNPTLLDCVEEKEEPKGKRRQ